MSPNREVDVMPKRVRFELAAVNELADGADTITLTTEHLSSMLEKTAASAVERFACRMEEGSSLKIGALAQQFAEQSAELEHVKRQLADSQRHTEDLEDKC